VRGLGIHLHELPGGDERSDHRAQPGDQVTGAPGSFLDALEVRVYHLLQPAGGADPQHAYRQLAP
jgi:hypothetical protein